MGVLHAAELGALSAKSAWAVSFDPLGGHTGGNQVALAMQIGDPKTVDHVVRCAADHHRTAYGNMDLIRGDHYPARVIVQIPYMPPPLVSGHLDDHSVLLRSKFGNRLPRGNADHQQQK